MRTRLAKRIQELGLELSDESWSKTAVLGQLWGRYGEGLGLTGARDEAGLDEHVLEGFQAVACAKRANAGEGRWLDVGSGAGFPGLLAVAAGWTVDLVEPRARRAGFLELALGAIEARESRVLRGRIDGSTWNEIDVDEELGPQLRGYAVASARAVMAPNMWLETGSLWVRAGGVVLVHLRPDDPDPDGREPASRVDTGRWSVRGYRLDSGGAG